VWRIALVGVVFVTATSVAAVSSAQSTVTPPEWARKANAVCAVGNAKIRALGHPTTLAATITAVRGQIYWTKWEVRRLRALPVPAATAPTVRLMLRQIDSVIALWGRALTALKGGRIGEAQTLTLRARPHLSAANAAARRLGARTCAATS
jgi:hypothetical protein